MSRNLLLKVVTFLLKAPNLGRLWIIHVWIIRPTKTNRCVTKLPRGILRIIYIHFYMLFVSSDGCRFSPLPSVRCISCNCRVPLPASFDNR